MVMTTNKRGINMTENIEIMEKDLPSLEEATAEELANAIAEVLDSKKAFDIEVLPVAEKTVLAEYFVIASGNTSTHIKSLVDEGCSASEIAGIMSTKTHKMGEYRAKLYAQSAAGKSWTKLREALDLCVEADLSMKLSQSGYAVIEKLVCSI